MHALTLALLVACPHDSTLADAARAALVPPAMAQAVARVESNCQTRAVSPTDARGLMQILPSWLRTDQQCERLEPANRPTCLERRMVRRNLVARCGTDLHDPATNACFGARILRYEFHRAGGSWPAALRAYSGGAYPSYWAQVRAALRRVCAAQRAEAARAGPHPTLEEALAVSRAIVHGWGPRNAEPPRSLAKDAHRAEPLHRQAAGATRRPRREGSPHAARVKERGPCTCGGFLDWTTDGDGNVVEFCVGREPTAAHPGGIPACRLRRLIGSWVAQPEREPLAAVAPDEPGRRCRCGRKIYRFHGRYRYADCLHCRERAHRAELRAAAAQAPPSSPPAPSLPATELAAAVA